MSLIGLGFAVAAIVLVFRRDFKEAAGVFAVGIIAVLLATPAGVSVLQDTVASLFGAAGVMASEIRSYRRVFDLERRIYSIDRLRLNPGGVPCGASSTSWRSLARAVARRRLPAGRALRGRCPGICATSLAAGARRDC